jgi:hypothetical protein
MEGTPGTEPDFQNEQELENAVASGIRRALDGTRSVVLHGLGVGLDIVVFTERADGTVRTCLFEMKVNTLLAGRCGINTNQVRLLLDDALQAPRNGSQISLLDQSVRWVLFDCRRPVNTPRFLFFSASRLRMPRVEPEYGGCRNPRGAAFKTISRYHGLIRICGFHGLSYLTDSWSSFGVNFARRWVSKPRDHHFT